MKKLKNSIEECNKDQEKCINNETCKGKWYRYRAKDDNGYCKTCIKIENEKYKNIKLDKNRNYIYDCITVECAKGLRFQKTDHCLAGYCKRCFDNM